MMGRGGWLVFAGWLAVSPAVWASDEPPGLERARQAMREALSDSRAAVEILAASRALENAGRVEFARRDLRLPSRPAADSHLMWPGWVVDGSGERQPVWARVRITTPVLLPVANEDLKAGAPLAAGSVKWEERPRSPFGETPAGPAEMEGKALARAVKQGVAIRKEDLVEARMVEAGRPVTVEVRSGGMLLRFETQARTSGRRGERVSLMNPWSQQLFSGVVQGPGAVAIDLRRQP